MTTQAPPKWLDDEFSVLPTNFVVARNAAALTPAPGAPATFSAAPITVQKSGNFAVFLGVRVSTVVLAGTHNVNAKVTGTDSFVGSYAPSKPFVNDNLGFSYAVFSLVNLDQSGLQRGSTVTYTATITPAVGGDQLYVNANDLLLLVVEL